MFSSFKRRARKSSPEPDRTSIVNDKHDNKGRRRRRAAGGDPDSLLPTTYHSNGGSPSKDHNYKSPVRPPSLLPNFTSPAANPCNSFLLGGHYYPGKDKKRRHLRKKTLWHRIFCSSRWRIIVTAIITTYLLVWYLLVPGMSQVLEYGAFLSGGRHKKLGAVVLRDGKLVLPDLQAQKLQAKRVEEERHDLSQNRRRERLTILEKISPSWFHRNDLPVGAKEKKKEEKKTNNKDQEDVLLDDAMDVKKKEKATAKPTEKQQARKGADTAAKAAATAKPAETKPPAVAKDADTKKKFVQRTLLNMNDVPNQSSCPVDLAPTALNTTLVVQCSLERLWILKETCSRWKDPIVAVVNLLPTENLPDTVEWKESCPQLKILSFQMPKEEARDYPVNHLRNLGLDAVQTSHIMVVDVDFVPSDKLHELIQHTLREREKQRQLLPGAIANQEHDAIVVPAFERLDECETVEDCKALMKKEDSYLPKTVDELKTCLINEDCAVFQSGNNWEGHYSTRSGAWLKGNWYQDDISAPAEGDKPTITFRPIREIKCFDSLRYEPYVVIRWCPAAKAAVAKPVAPYYDERFFGYGKNKIQMISHLRFMGYRFSVLPKGFIVHHPHPESKVKQIWNNRRDYKLHSDMDRLYPQFLQELMQKYPTSSESPAVKLCDYEKEKKRRAEKKEAPPKKKEVAKATPVPKEKVPTETKKQREETPTGRKDKPVKRTRSPKGASPAQKEQPKKKTEAARKENRPRGRQHKKRPAPIDEEEE